MISIEFKYDELEILANNKSALGSSSSTRIVQFDDLEIYTGHACTQYNVQPIYKIEFNKWILCEITLVDNYYQKFDNIISKYSDSDKLHDRVYNYVMHIFSSSIKNNINVIDHIMDHIKNEAFKSGQNDIRNKFKELLTIEY